MSNEIEKRGEDMSPDAPPRPRKIVTAAQLRGVLLATIEGVLEGRVSVPMANSVVGLSEQVHSSLYKEWDMSVYAAENLGLHRGRVIDLLIGE